MTDVNVAPPVPPVAPTPSNNWEGLPNLVSVRDSLAYVNKTICFFNPADSKYYYYKIKTENKVGLFYNLSLNPPLTLDGFLGLDKKIYNVSKVHLLKRKVYVSDCNIHTNTRSSSVKPGVTTSSPGGEGVLDKTSMEESDQPEVEFLLSEEDWVGIDAASNTAFEKQISELHEFLD